MNPLLDFTLAIVTVTCLIACFYMGMNMKRLPEVTESNHFLKPRALKAKETRKYIRITRGPL